MKYYLFAGLHFLLIYFLLKSFGIFFVQVLCFFAVFRFLWSVIIFASTFGFTKQKFLNDEVDPHNKAVFITGCDTGFGHQLAKRLDAKGFHVFAGCLNPEGNDALSLEGKTSERLKIVHLDVTRDEIVEKAAELVKTNLGSCSLWAVVNNAGIHKGFGVEDTGLDEFRDTLEVNALGPLRVIKAFLPMLKEDKGRIVSVTSLIGRTVLPFFTPYCVSKSALVALVDCLRQEVSEYGIRVISVEPEIFQTNLTKKSLVNERMNYTFDSNKLKKEDLPQKMESLKKISETFLSCACQRTELVVDDMEHAVVSKYPNTGYSPRRNFFWRFLMWVYVVIPVDIRDLFVRVVLAVHKRIF